MRDNLTENIEGAIAYLMVIQKWNMQDLKDKNANANIKNWLFKLLTRIEAMAKEIEKYE